MSNSFEAYESLTLTKKNFSKVGNFAQLQKLITFDFKSFVPFFNQLGKLVPK